MTIADNIAARWAYTNTLNPPMSAGQAAEALFGWVYKQPGMAKIEHCRHTLQMIADKFGQGESVALLQRYGVTTLGELWLGAYQGVVELGQACLSFDVPPSAGWSQINDVYAPNKLRRLMWHSESNCLFEVTTGEDYLTACNAPADDVTGIPEFENRFKDERDEL